MRAAILGVAFFAGVGVAHADQLTTQQMDEAARGAFQHVVDLLNIEICFDQARLMIFGFVNKQQGHSIDRYVESGALPEGSTDYQMVKRGYGMDAVLDNASKAHFMGCVRKHLNAE